MNPQRPTSFLSLGTTAWKWLNADGFKVQDVSLRARMSWQAHWVDINWSLSRRLRSAVRLVDPIFVVGPWRSGTTVMHECLAAATGQPTTQTWQCMNASSFLLTGKATRSVATPRPMDELPIHAESPQEDEFALLTLGAESAYRAFLSPQRISTLHHTLDQAYWLDNGTWCDTWLEFLQACLTTRSERSLPLLLKSPNHTFRVQAILRQFPNASFIWMSRDPSSVFHSNRKMWAQMFDCYGFDRPMDGALDEFIAEALVQSARTLKWCTKQLDRTQLAIVDTKSFEAAPFELLQSVCAGVGLSRSFRPESLQRRLSSMSPRFGSGYHSPLSPLANKAILLLTNASRDAHRTHSPSVPTT